MQAHHALDDRQLCIGGGSGQDVSVRLRCEHPGVQVPCDPTGSPRMVTGIDKVRPGLERLHAAASSFQGRQERQRHRCLPHSAVSPGYDEAWIDHRFSLGR